METMTSHESQPKLFRVSVNGIDKTQCPIHDRPYQTDIPKIMRRHFRNMHIDDTIIISEEGPLPRRSSCGLFQ
jgi:hypothetical protein